MDRDLLFDIRLQSRHLAKKTLTPEDLEAYLASLPDVSDNIANPEALPQEASSNEGSAPRTTKPSGMH